MQINNIELRGKVKFFDMKKNFGFIEVEGEEKDYYFRADSEVKLEVVRGNRQYWPIPVYEPTPVPIAGLPVTILSFQESSKGKMAVEWTRATCDPIPLFAVIQTHITTGDYRVAAEKKECYERRVHEHEQVAFIGTEEECKDRGGDGTIVRVCDLFTT